MQEAGLTLEPLQKKMLGIKSKILLKIIESGLSPIQEFQLDIASRKISLMICV